MPSHYKPANRPPVVQPIKQISSPINVNRNTVSPTSLSNYTTSNNEYSVVNRFPFQNTSQPRSTSYNNINSNSFLSNDNNRIVMFI